MEHPFRSVKIKDSQRSRRASLDGNSKEKGNWRGKKLLSSREEQFGKSCDFLQKDVTSTSRDQAGREPGNNA